jgi:glutathione S-transferase
MSLILHYHPLASFCWKALVALYENDTQFTPLVVDLSDERSRTAFFAIWPMGKFPVLEDEGRIVPESSIIIEYLALHHPGPVTLVPSDPEEALAVRLADRFLDGYLHAPMQKIVGDRLRRETERDPLGVAEARATIRTAYDLLERNMEGRTWAAADYFTLADCAAFPALFYGNKVEAIGNGRPNVAGYLDRLVQRPSVSRVLEEAAPYFRLFPASDS